MPIYIQDILVVTKEELVPEFFTSDNLRKTLSRYKDRPDGLKRYQRGGGRGHRLLVLFDSLPRWIRDSIGDPRIPGHLLLKYYSLDAEAVSYYSRYRDDAGYIEPESQHEYAVNASVLNAVSLLASARLEEWKSKGRSGSRGLLHSLYADYSSFGDVLMDEYSYRHTLPENETRFLEKYRKYTTAPSREEAYNLLISGKRGNNNAGARFDKVRSLLENMFTCQACKPDATEIQRQYEGFLSGYVEVISRDTGEVIDPKGYPSLSRTVVKEFLHSWESSVASSRKRTGNRQIRLGQYVPFETLQQPRYSGSVISVDDRQPPFFYKKNTRMWFYCGVDLGSEAITAWVYGTSKEGIILEFYRQLVRNYAEWNLPLPWEIECESNLNASYRDGFLKEGAMFRKVRIEANSARSKRCERYWRDVRYTVEKKRPEWIARPFARSEANQAGTGKEEIIPYDQLVENCLQDIETWNNMECRQYPGKSRWEVFLEKQNPDNTNSINYHAILPTLGYRTSTSVSMGGQIRFNGGIYMLGSGGEIATGESLIGYMRAVAGKQVDIYWLDGNDGSLLSAVICLAGERRIVCEAVRQPVTSRSSLEETPEMKKNRELVARYRNTLEGYSRRRYSEMDDVVVIDNRPLTVSDKFRIRPDRQATVTDARQEVEILDDTDSVETPFEQQSASDKSFVKPLYETF